MMNWISLVAALPAFVSIWVGHVAVRKIEFVSPMIWLPTLIFISLGLFAEYYSLVTVYLSLQTALGIAGITLFWDALEITRQQKRVIKGRAPANPNNPRHARILADPNSHATPHDLLKREPIGKQVTND